MIIKCANCNKEFEPSKQIQNRIKKEPDKPRFCSPKCRAEHTGKKRKITEEYICDYCGKKFILSSDQRRDKAKNPNNKYFCGRQCSGKYNMSIEDNVIKRNRNSEQTKLNKYGDAHFNNHDKTVRTLQDKYNVDNVFQLDSIKELSKLTKLEKYNDANYNNKEQISKTLLNMDANKKKEWINKRKKSQCNTIQNRTDKEWEVIKNKLSESNAKAWKDMPQERKEEIKKLMSDAQKARWENMPLEKKQELFKKYRISMMDRYGTICNFTREEVQEKSRLNNGHTISKTNIKFRQRILEETGVDFSLEKDGFDLVKDDVAIDINPTFTHNCAFGFAYLTGRTTENKPLAEDYHYKRYLKASELGYHLINIWDWDDVNKILDMIKNKETLYARKLHIREVSTKDTAEFLNNYHIQNTCKGQTIRLGLYMDDELIELMTFGKPRYNKNYEWELLRLCTHKDYKVVGGAEKLFNCFVSSYEPNSIISYCDISKFTGDVYKRLGFTQNNKILPSKHWSKGSEHITDNLLRQRGYDQLFNANYGKGTSNEELMILNGWLPVYDCGQITYLWKNSEN